MTAVRYEIDTDGTLSYMIIHAGDCAAVGQLMKIEPCILSTVIPTDDIDETAIITSLDELSTAVTSHKISTLLIELANSVSKYLDTDPTFDRLI